MRHQHVSVNVWQMMFTSCTYLALAFLAWLLLRLIHACFWLPGYLTKQRDEELKKEAEKRQKLSEEKQKVQSSEDKADMTDGQIGVGEESKKTI
jgi:hypothetical protein